MDGIDRVRYLTKKKWLMLEDELSELIPRLPAGADVLILGFSVRVEQPQKKKQKNKNVSP